jgi:hypothetical protein
MEDFAVIIIRDIPRQGLFVEKIEKAKHVTDDLGTTWTRLASTTISAMLETLTLPARTAVVQPSSMMLFLT